MENTPSFAVTEGPLVTLVVPMYNVAPYLERCLRSLERQTYRNIEVIIMDDCSTDGSLDIASKMAASDMRRFSVCPGTLELAMRGRRL